MEKMYKCYVCKRCKKETILITEEVEDTIRRGKQPSCSHCKLSDIHEEEAVDDLRKCMDHNSYKRRHGAIRQVRSG